MSRSISLTRLLEHRVFLDPRWQQRSPLAHLICVQCQAIFKRQELLGATTLHEATYSSVLVLEGLDFAGTLPKLYVVTVSELLGMFLGGLFVSTEQIGCATNLTVCLNNVRSILGHFRSALTPLLKADFMMHMLAVSVRFPTQDGSRISLSRCRAFDPKNDGRLTPTLVNLRQVKAAQETIAFGDLRSKLMLGC
jgi:hypothetical protein